MAGRTPYQDRIIRRYYENQGDIVLQRLSELVGDLYLAEGKSRSRLWQRAEGAMRQMKVPADRIEHILHSDNPSLLAGLVKELQAQ
jgi:hypothetical protein